MGMFQRQGEHCVAPFTADEVRVLRRVVSEMRQLLSDGFDRRDPAIERLFPDAYPDKPTDSAQFRRYTEVELKRRKLDQAHAVLATLPTDTDGEVRLDSAAAESWLRALNDARLAMAVRLEIKDEDQADAEIRELESQGLGTPRSYQLAVYTYLGYLQESLLQALTGPDPAQP